MVNKSYNNKNHKTTSENDYEDSKYTQIIFFFKIWVSCNKK